VDIIKYWDERYKKGLSSGKGSQGEFKTFKADYINNMIKIYGINTIGELGTGDGNMLSSYTGFKEYYGYDISKIAIDKCSEIFKNRPDLNFVYNISDIPIVDLSMSIDVSYHIIDEKIFYEHLEYLYNISKNYILIYTVNTDDNHGKAAHIKYRRTNDIFLDNHKVKLIDCTPNPIEGYGHVRFYLYEKIKRI